RTLSVSWAACSGITGKGRLKATLIPDCSMLTGSFVAKKSKLKKLFSAPRSQCGDGAVDMGALEQCDGEVGCSVGSHCTTRCRCVVADPTQPVRFGRDVQPILTRSCAVPLCHVGENAQEQLNLAPEDSYDALLEEPSMECSGRRVSPGMPDASYMIAKLRGSGPCFLGTQMPQTGALSAHDVQTITDWVTE